MKLQPSCSSCKRYFPLNEIAFAADNQLFHEFCRSSMGHYAMVQIKEDYYDELLPIDPSKQTFQQTKALELNRFCKTYLRDSMAVLEEGADFEKVCQIADALFLKDRLDDLRKKGNVHRYFSIHLMNEYNRFERVCSEPHLKTAESQRVFATYKKNAGTVSDVVIPMFVCCCLLAIWYKLP